MIVLIDNYDSFVYNIYQYLSELGEKVKVYRNDEISIDGLMKLKNMKAIVLSPGPGNPNDAGICLEVIQEFHRKVPILGICLGHQAIGQYFGGEVVKAKRQLHGKSSQITTNKKGIFNGIDRKFKIIRYHSLIVKRSSLPRSLQVTASSEDGYIMAIQHKKYPVFGLQFHPESYLSENGHNLLKNLIDYIK